MLKRGNPVTVGDGPVGTGPDQGAYRLYVVGPAVAQDDRFDQGGPAEVVHMIQRCTAGNEAANHLMMAQMRAGDQRRVLSQL